MDNEFREKLRDIILDDYGLDIREAEFHFSTQNYIFVFSSQPVIIRVSIKQSRTREEVLSEMMWVDDLKQFKETICEPSPSLHGKLIEEFEIDGIRHRAGMFREARGGVLKPDQYTPLFFICIGDLIGTIHKVSTNERIIGMNYKRKHCDDINAALKEVSFPHLDRSLQDRINELDETVRNLPKEAGKYGLCHGDLHGNNFFVEANNIWLFDFDSSLYADYLFDVATLLQVMLLAGYKPEKSARAALYEDMLPYFKIGYELQKGTDTHYWDNLELFMSYRAAHVTMALTQIGESGISDTIEKARMAFSLMTIEKDSLKALDMIRAQMKSSGKAGI